MRILCAAACFLALSTSALAQQAAPAAQPASDATTAPAAVKPPEHPITQKQTQRMFDLMNFEAAMDGMMNQMIAMQNRQAPFIPPAVWDDFRTTFKKTDFVALFLPIYQKYLSEEDAAKSLQFYETPEGRHMLQVMPLMMADISQIAGNKGQEIGQEVVQRHMAEIQAAAKKYQDEHPQPQGPTPLPMPAPAPSADKPQGAAK